MGDMQTNAISGKATSAVPQWTFADRLRKIRTDAGYDQRAFAQLIGVKAPTYSTYETGRIAPRYRDIGAFAARVEALTGVPAWWLLDLHTPEHAPVVELDTVRAAEDIMTAHLSPNTQDAIVTQFADHRRDR